MTALLKLRKELLQQQAAVERVKLGLDALQLQRASTLSAIVRNALPSDRTRSWWSRALETAKRYPFLMSAASIVASRFRIPLVTTAAKYGGLATLVYKVWESWRAHHPVRRMRR